jgi:hypothetical protein
MGVLKEAFVPLVVCIYWLVYYLTTKGLPKESTIFPYFLMVIMPFMAIMILIKEYRERRGVNPDPTKKRRSFEEIALSYKNPAILYLLSILYLILFIFTNYLISTAIYLIGAMIIFKEPWHRSIVIGVGLAISLYVVFGVIFKVPI